MFEPVISKRVDLVEDLRDCFRALLRADADSSYHRVLLSRDHASVLRSQLTGTFPYEIDPNLLRLQADGHAYDVPDGALVRHGALHRPIPRDLIDDDEELVAVLFSRLLVVTTRAQAVDDLDDIDPAVPVVFVDFDGVLNHAQYLYVDHPGATDTEDDADMLDPACVARLGAICARTGAKVVISSSWRARHTTDALRELLARRGFTGEVVGRTANLGARFLEIRMYAARHRLARWIAIDDGVMPELGDRMLVTSWAKGGLSDEHVAQAVRMLTR